MTAPVPTEPTTDRPLDELLADRQANGDQAALTDTERDALYAFMWADPDSRPARHLKAAFPEIWAEITTAAETFDVRQDGSGYIVRGEPGETGGKQAHGLDAGQVWVARYVGTYIGFGYSEDEAWATATAHCRQVHGATE